MSRRFHPFVQEIFCPDADPEQAQLSAARRGESSVSGADAEGICSCELDDSALAC
jgi:hypothetical protein